MPGGGTDPYMELPRSLELGKLVDKLTGLFLECNRDWVSFVHRVHTRPCLHAHVKSLPHSAAAYLHDLRADGAPVQCTTPLWASECKDRSMQRGPHPSTRPYLHFLESDMADMITKGYWVVLPYKLVKDIPNLRISPMGAVPQRERRPRIIVDYSFSGINQETHRGAPPEAMQFGRALERVLRKVATADTAQGPLYLLKIDLSDGFYRVRLRAQDAPMLGVAFPVAPGEPLLTAIPLVLPMGWTESPPYFCTTTETIVDLANLYSHSTWDPPSHPLEVPSATAAPWDGHLTITVPPPDLQVDRPPKTMVRMRPPTRLQRRAPALRYADVYIDDEILVAQGPAHVLNKFRRQAFHINDRVFRPNDGQDDPSIRREPISAKKLDKGDACWSTRKVILGWLIDTLQGTIELPPHRRDRLNVLLQTALTRKRITMKEWRRILRELRSMVLGIPGGRGLLSQLQLVLQRAKNHRIHIHKEAQHQLLDLQLLAHDLANRPTRIGEVLRQQPTYVGCCDAAKSGMGGVWLPSAQHPLHPPYVWRSPFPSSVQQALVSTDNPLGSITNSDLELAGTIAHEATLAAVQDLRHCTIATFSDNTPAVAWGNKASTTTAGPASYLLRSSSLLQRQYRYLSQRFYIPGPANHLADVASRRFDLSNDALLSFLNSVAPHTQPWQLPPAWLSRLTTDLQRRRHVWPSLASVPPPKIVSGPTTGSLSPTSSAWTPFLRPWKTRYPSSASWRTEFGTAVPAAVVNRYGLSAYVTRSWPSRRVSPTWDSRIRA